MMKEKKADFNGDSEMKRIQFERMFGPYLRLWFGGRKEMIEDGGRKIIGEIPNTGEKRVG